MKNKNVCLKGDGTKGTGKKIIKHLESLGGYNRNGYTGAYEKYYYIKRDNDIVKFSIFPSGYTLISLPEDKPLPKWMLVWDEDENRAEVRYVVFKDKNNYYVAIADSYSENSMSYRDYLSGEYAGYVFYTYKYAKDIESESPLLKEKPEDCTTKIMTAKEARALSIKASMDEIVKVMRLIQEQCNDGMMDLSITTSEACRQYLLDKGYCLKDVITSNDRIVHMKIIWNE